MAKFLSIAILLLGMALRIEAMGLEYSLNDVLEEEDRDSDSERTILILNSATSGTFLGLNLTQLLPLLALAAATLLPLLCLCALGMLLLLNKNDSGYGSQHDTGYASSYSQYQRAFSNLLDWDKLSIVDWISLGEEAYRNYDPTDMDCHKKFICEVHKNVKQFGEFAASFVQVFGYLKYSELFSLPSILQEVVDEFIDAANTGRSLKTDCVDTYPHCDFSIKKLYEKYSLNKL